MKKVLRLLIPTIGIAFGLIAILYFPASEMYSASVREKIIDSLNEQNEKTASESDAETKEANEKILKQARSYNELLAGEPSELPADEVWSYPDQLPANGDNTAFAWIRIPKISLDLPIYHGTDSAVLNNGVGHLESSSLPVSGNSVHSVLSAHSGMPDMRMFDDIRELEVGDYFALNVLGNWQGYKITSIETVLPEETDSLEIQPGKDLCTLVTCTPYGINDHRLLVHAEAFELPDDFYAPASEITPQTVQRFLTNRRVWPAVAALLAVELVMAYLIYKQTHPKRNRNKRGR